MSRLIDYLVFEKSKCCTHTQHNGYFYIAKDMPLYGFEGFIHRLKDAIRVLFDKSRAYHFKEDE